MSETSATETGKPASQPGSETTETVIVSVDDAATLLGISPQAVRKRIAKGTLPAQRAGRSWQVLLERDSSATAFRETTKPTAQPGSETSATVANFQAAQLAALVEPFTTPLVARIESLSRETERERARANQAEQERDELAMALEHLKAEQRVPVTAPTRLPAEPEESPPPTEVSLGLAWRRWFRRLMGQP